MYNKQVRLSVIVAIIGIVFYLIFNLTPDLSETNHPMFYRICVAMFFVTGISELLFGVIGLFPVWRVK